jgi:hypothetical protein
MAGSIAIIIQPGYQSAYLGLVQKVTAFVTRWFDLLNAANAFVSHYGIVDGRGEVGDHPLITRYERASCGPVMGWHAVRRYVRGVFWAMGLGADLCNLLGGQAAILHNSPAARASELDAGVWLQASDEPPGTSDEIQRLADFVQPLLGTTADIRALDAEAKASQREPDDAGADAWAPIFEEAATLQQESLASSEFGQTPVPLRGLRALIDLEVDATVNLHLEEPPSRQQLVRLVATMQAWYEDGFSGAFGGEGLHSLGTPTLDGRVVRWKVDMGSADTEHAIRALAARLGDLTGVKVKRLVLGTESGG